MKTIIAGCRDYHDYDHVRSKIDHFRQTNQVTEIVSGNSSGVDVIGERYARENDIPLTLFPADWIKHGRSAGPIRNKQMADYADQLLAVWDGKSKGTKNMIETMNKLKKPVFIIWIGEPFVATWV